jgi:sulfatase maturation enzyme AslB (radical SAM superfamily)
MRKNFCAAPWAGISIDPDGNAKVCCVSKERVPLVSFAEIKLNSKFIEIRSAIINDEQPTNCQTCWDQESSSAEWTSRRSIYQYNDFYHNLDSANDFQLEHLDLRWSNTCNLNCVYCSPVFSSKWAELKGQKQSFRVFPTVTDNDLSNLKMLQLAGGEPLLIKENLDLLNRCLKINPDVEIEITTNLTNIKNNRIYECLKQFKNVHWILSFESTEKKFEYIRNGAKWDEFLTNLSQLTNDFKNVQVNMVYFPLSSTDIQMAIRVAMEYIPANNIFFNPQFGGHGFDMLGQNALQSINKSNTEFANQLPKILKQRLLDQIQLATTTRSDSYLPKYEEFDRLTNQNHQEIFSELYE